VDPIRFNRDDSWRLNVLDTVTKAAPNIFLYTFEGKKEKKYY